MRKLKLGFIGAAMLAGIYTPCLAADTFNTEILTKSLSELYGAEVQVQIQDDKCEILYPQVKMETTVPQYKDPQNPGEEPQVEYKTEVSYIPETVAACRKIDDYDGKAQYAVNGITANKFLAQLYNFWQLAFIKNIEIKNFSEETSIVPELGLVSHDKINVGDASYTTKNETTGLKSEIGSLKNLSVEQKVSKNGDSVVYSYDSKLDMLNVALPIFALQIKSGDHSAELAYKVLPDTNFDYSKPAQNIEYLVYSKTQAEDNGIIVNVDFFDFNLMFDTSTKNYTNWKEEGNFDSVGEMSLDNIKIKGSMVEAMLGTAKNLKSVSLKYAMNHVDSTAFKKISQIQQKKAEKTENDSASDAELAKAMDEALQKAELLLSLKFDFGNAELAGKFSLKPQNGYLTGVGKVEVWNLYNIFPEQKQCQNNPQAANIPACGENTAFAGLKKYIDVTKDNSSSVIKFSDKGIFNGNRKIGDPIEINFQKMQMEKEIRDKEQAEKVQEIMQHQKQNP